MYSVRKTGQPNTLEYRAYVEKQGVPISPWHDIPLFANKEQNLLNMVVEIPRWTNAKFEISRNECLNPIKQDVKNSKLRFVHNRFPHKGYIWNYGALPGTWEDPSNMLSETQTNGDNDPLDACEIGEQVGYCGQVKQVKVLGVMCLLDEGETDWKIIVIDINDPLATKLNDIKDVETYCPGLLRATTEWFRFYKVPDGKPENKVAFEDEVKNKEYAFGVIHECHESWLKLIDGKATQPGEISLANITNYRSPARLDIENCEVAAGEDIAPAAIEGKLEKWYFVPESAIRRLYATL